MLKKIPFPSAACDIVSRQEEFAGSDYPRGLGGVQILLGHASSRFADTLDTRCSGTQFDSEIVGVFLRMPDNMT
jgi:HD-GYP domain-containing protein (c-di-GMP phosphodiesterase class II)